MVSQAAPMTIPLVEKIRTAHARKQTAMTRRAPSLKMRTALKLLRRADARLVLTTDKGRAKYCVADGRITISTAKRILSRRDIVVDDAGLFCGHPQSWRRLTRRARHA
jgi:hypothetical protein